MQKRQSCIHTIKLTKYLPIDSRIGYTANLIDSILVHFCTSIYNTTQIIFSQFFFCYIWRQGIIFVVVYKSVCAKCSTITQITKIQHFFYENTCRWYNPKMVFILPSVEPRHYWYPKRSKDCSSLKKYRITHWKRGLQILNIIYVH